MSGIYWSYSFYAAGRVRGTKLVCFSNDSIKYY